MINAKENLIRAIRRDRPHYVPWSIQGIEMYPEYQHLDQGVIKLLGIAGNAPEFGQELIDNWGTHWVPAGGKDMYPHPKGFPLANLDGLAGYTFPDPDVAEPNAASCALLNAPDRESRLLFGGHDQMYYERAQWLCGMETFLIALHSDRARLTQLLRGIEEFQVALARRWVRLGVDGGFCSEDLGTQRSLMLHPDLWRELFKPGLARIIKVYKEAGKLFLLHSCGNISDIVGDLIEIGVDILNPVQAKAMCLRTLKERYGNQVCFYGGVDTQYTMTRGTPEEVEKETYETLKIFAPGGGYIASPDQMLRFPRANVESFVATVRRFGKYPLSF